MNQEIPADGEPTPHLKKSPAKRLIPVGRTLMPAGQGSRRRIAYRSGTGKRGQDVARHQLARGVDTLPGATPAN